jgi:TatD DNase family protein
MRDANTSAITIGTQPEDWDLIKDIAAQNPAQVRYTVGIHPTEVKENYREQIAALEKHLSQNNPLMVGIGEIGLDYFKMEEDPRLPEIRKRQRECFEAQLSILKSVHLPCCIHARSSLAYRECVEMIDRSGLDWSKFVFHCFSEGPDEVRELNARGGRASFTGIITFKNGQKMRDALLAQSPDKLMFETDAPFLSPEPHRGKVNEPSRASLVGAKAAELLKLPFEELSQKAFQNTLDFYAIKGW